MVTSSQNHLEIKNSYHTTMYYTLYISFINPHTITLSHDSLYLYVFNWFRSIKTKILRWKMWTAKDRVCTLLNDLAFNARKNVRKLIKFNNDDFGSELSSTFFRYNLIQNDVWLISRLLMSASASVKLNLGLRYHKSKLSSVFVCCEALLFSCLYIWLCSCLAWEAICWGPGDLRLCFRFTFICGLRRELLNSYAMEVIKVSAGTD